MAAVDCTELADAYGGILKRGEKRSGERVSRTGAEPRQAAETIYRAATDGRWRLRNAVGNDARQVWLLRRLLPEALFYRVLERAVLD